MVFSSGVASATPTVEGHVKAVVAEAVVPLSLEGIGCECAQGGIVIGVGIDTGKLVNFPVNQGNKWKKKVYPLALLGFGAIRRPHWPATKYGINNA